MKLLKNYIVSIATNGGRFFKLYPLFLAIFYVIAIISFGNSFFEDGLYVAKAESIIKDGDYNVINQVNETFSWLVTPEYFHPSHHTEIQTPSLVVFRIFEILEDILFEHEFLEHFFLASITISLLSLYYGFTFCSEILEGFNEKNFFSSFFIFFFSTVFLYFSICYLNVSEVFSFPLSAYLLNVVLLKKDMKNIKRVVCFSICSAVLLISKSIYLFPFLMSCYYILIENKNNRSRFIFLSIVSILVGTYFINMYDQFGEIEVLGRSAEIFLDFSFYNLFHTFFIGGFSMGGMFTSNPSYIPAVVFSLVFIYKLPKDRYDKFTLLMILIWLISSFFQTLFIVGDIYNDQFPGRLVLTSLPLLLIGFYYFNKFLRNRILKISIFSTFICVHLFSLINYLAITRIGHYQYASQKIVKSYSELSKMFDTVLFNVEIANYNFYFIALWSLLSYIIFKLFKDRLFYISQLVTGSLLVFFCVISIKNSQGNTIDFFKDNSKIKDNVVIGGSGEVYFYNYINDSLEFRMRATENQEIKNEIIKRRRIYYDIIKKNLVKSTVEFNDVLDNYIFYYGYYKED